MSHPGRRLLIVNADDFGQSAGINRGVIQAHEEGVVTSASLMVRHPGAGEAAAYARRNPRLSVGLHIDLGEWAYADDAWRAVYDVVALDDAGAVGEEIARQLDEFRVLVGRDPTHLDSHQHVHLRPAIDRIITPLAESLHLPLRSRTPSVRYCGGFYGQAADGTPILGVLTVEHFIDLLRALQPGITEVGCHPGYGDDLITMYRTQRADELNVLRDRRLPAAIRGLGIELRSFAEVHCEAGARI